MKPAQLFVGDLLDKLALPDVYQRIRTLNLDHKARIQAYSEVIEQDALLAERVVRIANSNYFGYKRKASELYQAIGIIGLIQLQDLLLCNLCMRAFAGTPGSVIDLNRFWEYSIGYGIAARSLAAEYNFPAGARFFALGLLHEIGHAIMFLKAPDELLKAIDDSQRSASALIDFESKYLGFNYTELGQQVMQSWQLPPVYGQVTRHHLQPQFAPADCRLPAAIVGLAHFLCQQEDDLSAWEAAQKSILPVLEWDVADLNSLRKSILAEIEQHKHEVMLMLWPAQLTAC